MGRMADFLRQAERARFDPDVPLADVAVAARPGDDRMAADLEPEPEPDGTIPFIEVGDPREPGMRLVYSPTEPLTVGPVAVEAPSAGYLTISFEPVHAGRLLGRGFAADLVAYHHPDHTISAQYRSLSDVIAAQLPGKQPRAVALCAAEPQSGASTVLLNLAVTMARQADTRVAVVDAHGARPAVAARLGLPAGSGLREVLAGQSPLAWCLAETAQPNMIALPAGKAGDGWDEAELPGVLDLLRGRADWVLVDAGPWDAAAVPAWAETCDAIYLVARHEAADAPEVRALRDGILAVTGRLRGCILTRR